MYYWVIKIYQHVVLQLLFLQVLVLNLIYYCGLFSFTGSPRLSLFLHQSLQSTEQTRYNLKTPSFSRPERVSLRVVFLLPPTNPFWICSHAVLWIQQRWPVADPAGHGHWARFTPSAWPRQHPSHRAAAHNRDNLIEGWAGTLPKHWQGQQGRHSTDSAKAGEKFSADFWGDHDFLLLALLDSLLVDTGELGEVRKNCWRKPGTYLLVNGKSPHALGWS